MKCFFNSDFFKRFRIQTLFPAKEKHERERERENLARDDQPASFTVVVFRDLGEGVELANHGFGS
jgi:hypothetical protein